MLKYVFGAVSAMIGFVIIANVTSSGGGGKSYDELSQEDQQLRLDALAKGFENGFRATARGKGEVISVYTDTEYDLVSISLKYTDERVGSASSAQIATAIQDINRQTCKLVGKYEAFQLGATLRVRMSGPTGAKLGVVQVDKDACRQFSS